MDAELLRLQSVVHHKEIAHAIQISLIQSAQLAHQDIISQAHPASVGEQQFSKFFFQTLEISEEH